VHQVCYLQGFYYQVFVFKKFEGTDFRNRANRLFIQTRWRKFAFHKNCDLFNSWGSTNFSDATLHN